MATRTRFPWSSTASLIAFSLLATLAPAMLASAQASPPRTTVDPALLAQLRYRHIGPVGNRVSSVAGVPGDPLVYYAGAASGGIWKTTDGGIHWDPIFDDKPVSSIGALAVAPSNPNIVWAGTGEPFIRSHISIGNGVYKSTDAGKTWTLMGLEPTGRIGRIVIHPTNPDIVYIAAQGHSYGPQQERGVYRTMDGGGTWERRLFVDENTGAIDIVMHPTNPDLLFAAAWQLEIRTWGRESGGPGSGIFISRDAGATWTRLRAPGLPTRTVGKIGLAIARSNPNRMYALIETGDGAVINGQSTDPGELWRPDDGGASWRVATDSTRPAPGFGSVSVLMPPGRYTVKLSVGGQEFTQPLEVRADPNVNASADEMRAQTETLLRLQTDVNNTVDMVNTIEVVRAQAQGLVTTLASDASRADVRAAADSLERKFIALEENLHQLKLTGQGQDGVRWPSKLGAKIIYLANGVASSDFAPTAQQREVHTLFQEEIRTHRATLEKLIAEDLARFNQLATRRGVRTITVALPRVVF